MLPFWAFARLVLSTMLGAAVVWAFSSPSPDWARRPATRPPVIDLSHAGLPDLGPIVLGPSPGAAAALARVVRPAPAIPVDPTRVPPPFDGLPLPEAAVALARAAQPLTLEAVQSEAGGWVIGYGHVVPDRPARAVTKAEAEAMLRADLEKAAAVVRAAVAVPLNENELGALTEFARSIGPENFERTLVVGLLGSGDREAAGDAFLLWTKARQDGALVESQALAVQRERTRALFLTRPAGE